MRHNGKGGAEEGAESWEGLMPKCRECRFIDYFTSENRYWCHQNKRYVNPEDSICEKYKPQIKGPLDKYIW